MLKHQNSVPSLDLSWSTIIALGQEGLGADHIPTLMFDIQQQLSMAGAATETVFGELCSYCWQVRIGRWKGMKSSLCQLITCVTYSWDSGREQVKGSIWAKKRKEAAGKGQIFVVLVLALLGDKRKSEGEKWTRTRYLLQTAGPMGTERDTTLSPELWWGFDGAMSVWRIEDRSPIWWNKPLALKGPVACFQLCGLEKGLFCAQHSAGFRMSSDYLQ